MYLNKHLKKISKIKSNNQLNDKLNFFLINKSIKFIDKSYKNLYSHISILIFHFYYLEINN